MFHDEVNLTLTAGKGGDGAVSFRREKYIPKGGPDGGDGGKGGNVIFRVDGHLTDLKHLASVRSLEAEHGVPGGGRKMYGAKGEDLIISVPRGTRLYRRQKTEWQLVKDLNQNDSTFETLRGGDGGLGNVHFATATHQTPKHAQPGQSGESGAFKLELQLIADVGIIGKPNTGKSTFLSIVSDAKPKIGDYPFTTLSPVLGVVQVRDKRIIMADIPGLIEGASEGKGLGLRFLHHIKRTYVLIHFIDSLSGDYAADYSAIRQEFSTYDPDLLRKPEIVVLTKGELITPDIKNSVEEKIEKLRAVIKPPSFLFEHSSISSATQRHLKELLNQVAHLVQV